MSIIYPSREVHVGPTVSVIVLSRNELATWKPELPFALVSITDPGSDQALVWCGIPRMVGRHDVQFYDITEDRKDKGHIYRTITEEQARGIAAYVIESVEGMDPGWVIACQCEVGVSRSAATAAAIWRYYHGEDPEWIQGYCPNRTVYERVLAALREEGPLQTRRAPVSTPGGHVGCHGGQASE